MAATDRAVSQRNQTTGVPLKPLVERKWGEQYLSEPVAVWRILNVDLVAMGPPISDADRDTNRMRGIVQRFVSSQGKVVAELSTLAPQTPCLREPTVYEPGLFLNDYTTRGVASGRFQGGELKLADGSIMSVEGDRRHSDKPGSFGPRDYVYSASTTLPGRAFLPAEVIATFSNFEPMPATLGLIRGKCRVALPMGAEVPLLEDTISVAGGEQVALIQIAPLAGSADVYDVVYEGSLEVQYELTDDDRTDYYPNPHSAQQSFPDVLSHDLLLSARIAHAEAYVLTEHLIEPSNFARPFLTGLRNPYRGSQFTIEELNSSRVCELYPGVALADIPGVDAFWYAYVGFCPEIHTYAPNGPVDADGLPIDLTESRRGDRDSSAELEGYAAAVAMTAGVGSTWSTLLNVGTSTLPPGAYVTWVNIETHGEFLRLWGAGAVSLSWMTHSQYIADKSAGLSATVAHELGHMLGLGHVDEFGTRHRDTLMGSLAMIAQSKWTLTPFERALVRLRMRRPGVPL